MRSFFPQCMQKLKDKKICAYGQKLQMFTTCVNTQIPNRDAELFSVRLQKLQNKKICAYAESQKLQMFTICLDMQIPKVQRTAARWTCRRWRNTSSVGNMLDDLEWPSLETRREQSSLTFFYKIHSSTVDLDKDKYLTPAPNLRRTRASHESQYTSDSEFRNIPVPVRFRIRQTDLFREKCKKIGPKINLFSVENLN